EERFEEAIALLHQAAEQAREPTLQASIQLDLALAGISTNFDHEPARAHAILAVEHAGTTGDNGLLAATLAVKTMTEFLLGHGVDEQQLARALELQQDRGRRRVETWPTLVAGLLGFYTGRVDIALSLLYPLRQEMLEHGEDAELPFLSINLAWLEMLIGNAPPPPLLSHAP